jgi:hypothetical protein
MGRSSTVSAVGMAARGGAVEDSFSDARPELIAPFETGAAPADESIGRVSGQPREGPDPRRV